MFIAYRETMESTWCELCGLEKARFAKDGNDATGCTCIPVSECEECAGDIVMLSAKETRKHTLKYKCMTHGAYRHYEDFLLLYKNWCVVCVVLTLIPFTLVVVSSGLNLNWACLAGPVLLCPFLIPLMLTITWVRTTGAGIVIGLYS